MNLILVLYDLTLQALNFFFTQTVNWSWGTISNWAEQQTKGGQDKCIFSQNSLLTS